MFGNRIRTILHHVYGITRIVCTVLVLVGAALLAILFAAGRTSFSRIKTAGKVLLGYERETIEIVREIAPAEFAITLEEFEKRKREQEDNISRRRAAVEAHEMDLKIQYKRLEEEKAALAQQQAAFQAAVADFNRQKQAHQDFLASAGFAKTKELIETAPAKTVVEMMKNWDVDRIMVYLRAIETRIVSKILQEMQRSTDAQVKKLAEDIQKRLE